ncbi:MAG: cbb3-type cytochrome c oxidase subunit I [Vulcanimicrobiaceae bacterium]
MKAENRLILAHLYVAFAALAVGTTFGLLQTLSRAGAITMPVWFDYYRMLTAHGVLLALVFTTFFIVGLSTYAVYRTIPRRNRNLVIPWTGWWVMTIGTVMAAYEILSGGASVLYTFYAPLKADPWFYVGVALLIIGTWFVVLDFLMQAGAWKAEHGREKLPLPAFMALVNFIMWFLATIGVAFEVVVYLIPWAFGWTNGVDVLMTRMLFWYFGHPLVYFWMLGAYLIWYAVVPGMLKVPVFSDTLTRVAFILFLVLSLPIGIHHEFMDPGIADKWKLLVTFLTLAVVIPSLMTAFALFATFEEYAAKHGKFGFINIVRALPWADPMFAGITLAMILFIFGGFGGIVNASYSMDILVHNTMWVVGHFHITVGGPVALTFLASSYRLIPALTGRVLRFPGVARAQVWLWFIGMSIMSFGMHVQGLLGAPRRTANLTYGGIGVAPSWELWAILMAVGGVILLTSVVTFFTVLIGTLRNPERDSEAELTFAPSRPGDEPPFALGRLGVWAAVAVLLVIVAYGGPVYQHLSQPHFNAPGMRTW